jgi:hypothetical protein
VKPTTTTKPSTTTTKPGGGGDCTYTQGYYKNHEEVVQQLLAANGGTLTVAGHQLTAADIDYLYGTSPSGNYLIAVGHQLVTAKLNQLSGASTPTGVGAAITAAEALVVQQLPSGTAKPDTKVTSGGRTYTASELNDLLTNYNEGKSGPRHCG